MIKNNVKALWNNGSPAINGWLSIGNPFTAEIMAAQDYDSITIDMQHGALDYSATLPMLQAMRASGKTLFARVPWLDPGIIMMAMDAGAEYYYLGYYIKDNKHMSYKGNYKPNQILGDGEWF